jgi:ABC-2 type transport system permease protein
MSTSEQAREFEALKFRRAPVVRTVFVLIGVGLPVLAAAFMVDATSDGSSQIGLKAAAMLTSAGWAGYLAMVGMLLSVGALMGIGFVVCWCFGREFTEKTQACLFALPVSRRRLAYAKFAVILLWALLLCLVSVAVALLADAVIGLGVPVLRIWWPRERHGAPVPWQPCWLVRSPSWPALPAAIFPASAHWCCWWSSSRW